MTSGARVRVGRALAQDVSITVADRGCPSWALDDGARLLREIDETFSPARADSPVARLGRGDIRLAECPPEVAEVLALCVLASHLSRGHVGAMREGRLDPTAVLTGWVVDQVHHLLWLAGSRSHLVVAGDVARATGSPLAGEFPAGLPPGLRRDTIRRLSQVGNAAVATSRPPRRDRTSTGATGTGRARGWAWMSVIAPTAWLAEVYAAAALAHGVEACWWLESHDGVEACGVDTRGRAWRTPGWPGPAGGTVRGLSVTR
jgi:thiamine biosynthesis lipoprotein